MLADKGQTAKEVNRKRIINMNDNKAKHFVSVEH